MNIKKNINEFISAKGKKFDHRYDSFDFCYEYFQSNKTSIHNNDLTRLHLGFYLASWGMYRGSSFLLKKNVNVFESTIDFISRLEPEYWNIDIDNYSDENIERLIFIYKGLRDSLVEKNTNSHLTLITKIMMGVFGNVPAFDKYVIKGIKNINKGKGISVFNKNSLNIVSEFYNSNKQIFDSIDIKVRSIDNKITKFKYSKAKLVDMSLFIEGQKLEQQ